MPGKRPGAAAGEYGGSSPAQLIALLSQVAPLKKGDVLLTGTPGGIGPVFPGDIVEVEIEQIGILRNIVIKEREMQA